jgi:hypothetical protein
VAELGAASWAARVVCMMGSPERAGIGAGSPKPRHEAVDRTAAQAAGNLEAAAGAGRRACETAGQHGPRAKRVAVPRRRGRASPAPNPATAGSSRIALSTPLPVQGRLPIRLQSLARISKGFSRGGARAPSPAEPQEQRRRLLGLGLGRDRERWPLCWSAPNAMARPASDLAGSATADRFVTA